MARKRKGSKGSKKMDPKHEWTLYGLVITVLLAFPIWAFEPFGLGLQIPLIIGASVTLFGFYGSDKGRAKTGGKRIPEIVLHGMSLIGGFPGAFIGMYFFRHKTRKIQFLIVIAVSAVIHVDLFLLLLR